MSVNWKAWMDEDRLRRLGRVRVAAMVFGLFAVFHALGTWSLPLIDRDEPRFAEAAREMVERNDWIVPHFNGEYRFDKPPLIYWLMAGSYAALGESDFAARLPSVLAAAGISTMLFLWGTTLFPTYRRALFAAALFGLSLQTFLHAKASVADMVMIFFMTGAVWCGWVLVSGARGNRAARAALWLVLAICLGLGFLTKGPIAWLPLLPVLALGAVRQRGAGFQLAAVAALLGAAGIVLIWAVPALRLTDGAYFDVGIGKHVVERSVNVMEGHGAGGAAGYIALLPLYFITVFISFFPGSLLLVPLVRATWGRRPDDLSLYLMLQAGVIFAVFTLVSTKLPHYTLPAFPALALWMARELGGRDDLVRRFRVAAAWSAGVLAFLALILFPRIARLTPSHRLAELAGDALTPRMDFASHEYVEPSLVWYLRGHVDGYHEKRRPEQLAAYLKRSGPRALILPTDLLPKLGDLDAFRTFRAKGLNIAKGQWIDVTMVVKTE